MLQSIMNDTKCDNIYAQNLTGSQPGLSPNKNYLKPGPNYGIEIVGKCLEPTTLKGPTKDGCRIFSTYVSQSITDVYKL